MTTMADLLSIYTTQAQMSDLYIDKMGIGNVKSYGATGDGTTDDTTDVNDTYDAGHKRIYFPTGIYKLSNLAWIPTGGLIIEGSGYGSVLDFSGVVSGDAFKISYDATSGGSKYIVLRNLTIRDSNDTSLADTLLKIIGGGTGETPSQTAAYVSLQNVYISEYNNTSGDAIILRNLSNVNCMSVYEMLQLGCRYGLIIDNNVDINTGIMTFTDCNFYGKRTAVQINCTQNLIDSINFLSCGMFNYDNALAVETMELKGEGISALNVLGCHFENRSNAASNKANILITGKLYASTFIGNHFSCGTNAARGDCGFHFSGATINGCKFENNEFLYLKAGSAGGYKFRFENDCTLTVAEPVDIGSSVNNTTAPYNISIEAGGNATTIRQAINSIPDTIDQTGKDYIYAFTASDATPSVANGKFFTVPSIVTITNFTNGIEGQEITVINAHASDLVTITTNTTIYCSGGVNCILNPTESITFVRQNSIWKEKSRADGDKAQGQFQMAAAATKTVTETRVKAASYILLFPANAAAATLVSGASSPYISAIVAGTSFTVATADAGNAAGTEIFNYAIMNE